MMSFIAAGIADAGEVSLSINFEPDLAIHGQLAADVISGTTRVFSITFADAGSTDWTANGFCTQFEPTGSVGEKLTASVTFKLTDTITL